MRSSCFVPPDLSESRDYAGQVERGSNRDITSWRKNEDDKRMKAHRLLALVLLAGLSGAPLVMADDPTTNAFLTGFGHGYEFGSGVGQGEFPAAFVNGSEDGYAFCASTRRVGLGAMFRIAWMRYVPSLATYGLADGRAAWPRETLASAGQARGEQVHHARGAVAGHVAGQVAGQERIYFAQRAPSRL